MSVRTHLGIDVRPIGVVSALFMVAGLVRIA
jgi:hypothetical protein